MIKVSGWICFQDHLDSMSCPDTVFKTMLPVYIKPRYSTTPIVPIGSISL